MFVLPVEQKSILQVRDGQFLCGWRYDICVVASRISVWVAIQHLCGWQYSICMVGNTISVWVAEGREGGEGGQHVCVGHPTNTFYLAGKSPRLQVTCQR